MSKSKLEQLRAETESKMAAEVKAYRGKSFSYNFVPGFRAYVADVKGTDVMLYYFDKRGATQYVKGNLHIVWNSIFY